MTIDFLRENGLILFECISGSHAYGTNHANSDVDKRGIFMCPQDMVYGFGYVDQVSDETNDTTFYELKRFLELLENNNPNIMEILFMPDENILHCDPIFQAIREHRHLFITKQCKNTFAGYATTQIKKARGLNKKIVNPVDKERKSILDFCHIVAGYDTIPLKNFLEFRGYTQDRCGLVNLPHAKDLYALFYDQNFNSTPIGYRGITNAEDTSNEVRLSSIPKGELSIATMIYNKEGYTKYCKDYKEYWEWVEKRNADRYETNASHGKNYDCYLDSETEFLTDKGWKKYDQITENDYLGTINNKNHSLEWEKYYDRFSGNYSGRLFSYENRYTRFTVTENHKLFLADTSRSIKNNFSTDRTSDFYFQTVSDWFANKKSYKHILISSDNQSPDYAIDDELLILIGLYISEGSIYKNKNRDVRGISLSQVKKGVFRDYIDKIKTKYIISQYDFFRLDRFETTYNIYDSDLGEYIKKECGEYCGNKKLPGFYLKLSKRQTNLLLDALMSGDGHEHKKGHLVYYSNSKQLIGELSTLLTLNMFNTQEYLYSGTSQLFISKKHNLSKCMSKRSKNVFGWSEKKVRNKKIVCFSINNGVLITRNKNKLAFQGNSKNMMHCIRLLRVALEIGKTGDIIVRRPDADDLMTIRRGERDYDDLIAEADNAIEVMNEIYEKSELPEKIDHTLLDEILITSRKKFYGTNIQKT